MANPSLVCPSNGTTYSSTSTDSENERLADIDTQTESEPSSSTKVGIDRLPCLRKSYKEQGLSEQSTRILLASWKTGTKKQYSVFIKRWIQYCGKKKISIIQSSIADVTSFLTELFETGLSYSSLNTARSALSAMGIIIQGHSVGTHPVISKFMRGVFNLRPSKPRHMVTWDVGKVLLYLKKLSPVKDLSLKDLTLKLTMLIALTNVLRVHAIHLLSIKNMVKTKCEFSFELSGLQKQSRPCASVKCVSMKVYPPDRRLCVYTAMKEYLQRTVDIRKNEFSLFLSFIKPHKKVSRDTVSRWIKTVMERSDIDTNVYGSHTVRSAVCSKAHKNSVPIQDILHAGGWSNAGTFFKFYKKDIISTANSRFVDTVLKE
ncbi:uncharacterized protein LOC126811206 isoform X1 [Patella vulgata]|uniref:uncharacterized protein LOC126811206 isoform X1 n=1 Tax=Patella vulgata TaxID=6465 RepID=UPI0024A7D77A|nr:uncharacterized protein LOC126811206 isoform X1 [Patella vulgata]XP_055954505.1 uncharacterized protein LOC126811206 isoform X1 [Patella vulgata]XP_055954506.1 uncharacterized protein LOC126811206 isoform X1 [Patella vulgata]